MFKKYVLIDLSNVLIIHKRWGNSRVNTELLDYLRSKRQMYSYVVVTSNAPEIEQHLESVYKIPKFYDHFISSQTYNLSKSDPKLYHEVLAVLMTTPEQCIFVDDTRENTEAAAQAGIASILYQHIDQFKKDLETV